MRNVRKTNPVRMFVGACAVVAFLALLLADARVSSAAENAMAPPGEHAGFRYELASAPVLSTLPWDAKPFGVLSSGDALTITVGFPPFTAPVDIYIGIAAEGILDDAYILREEGSLQSYRAGVTPWRRKVTAPVSETLFTGLPLAGLPQGNYLFYAGVSPAGSTSAFYVWAADLKISEITGRKSVSLKEAVSCDALIKTLQDRAVAEMEKTIEMFKEQVRQANGCIYPYYPPAMGFSAAPEVEDSARQYSTTNVQVPGVDEADFVKNDGSYIYVVADGALQIIDVWPPEQSKRVSTTAIEGEPKKLFVADDHALVYSSLGLVNPSGPYADPWGIYEWDFPSMEECTYGYDCDFTGDGRKSKITIFDISDRAKPVLQRELWFDGSYINSRRIGSSVHTVLVSPPLSFPGVSYWPAEVDRCFQYYGSGAPLPTVSELLAAFDRLKAANREAILATSSLDIFPSMRDLRYENGQEVSRSEGVVDCSDYLTQDEIEGQSFLSVVSLDIHGTGGVSNATVVGRPGAVYGTEDSLYVASRQGYFGGPPMPLLGFSAMPAPWEPPAEVTIVHKFGLHEFPAGVDYRAGGVVKGRVLNQFSMDEYQGYFRIATTTGTVGWDAHSTVTVLEQKGEDLLLTGQADNIAPNEDIRSARFDKDRAFLVTFKSNDPLFALDMSRPQGPRVLGELQVPGFSTFMQFMDEDHLLTIGYDAEDHGSFAYFQGIMLQIFDVADMKAPKLVHKELIGTRGTTSEAATNHLAFNYFAPKDMLAIPATVCEGSPGGTNYGARMTFSGLMVYDVTVDGGFSYHDGIPHVPPGSPAGYDLCYSWWTESNSVVQRSIVMDDYVFSIARDLIMAGNLNAPGNYFSVVNLISTAD